MPFIAFTHAKIGYDHTETYLISTDYACEHPKRRQKSMCYFYGWRQLPIVTECWQDFKFSNYCLMSDVWKQKFVIVYKTINSM